MGESICLVYVHYVFLVQIRGESLASKWLVGCDGFLEFRCYYFMVLSPKYMTHHVLIPRDFSQLPRDFCVNVFMFPA